MGPLPLEQNTGAEKSSRYGSYRQITRENGPNMKDWLGWMLMAPFIIGPIVELGLRLSDGTWHLNAFWVFLLSAMGWLWVWWVVKSGLWPGEGKASVQGF
jgi:hypothetical protein